MPPAVAGGIMAGGALLNAVGQRRTAKDAARAAAQGTTVSPWKPAQANLEHGLSEARALYEGRTPPPSMDYGQFQNQVPGQQFLPGGGSPIDFGGGGGSGGGSSDSRSSSGGGGRGGSGGGGGRKRVGFGGGIPGLNEDYELYMSGGDFKNMDSEFYRNYADASRRSIERAYAPRRNALIDEFDPGMMPTTMLGQARAGIEGEIGTAIGDSVIGGYGQMRGQNIGLLENTMGVEGQRLNTIEQANAQRASARMAASAQRYAADKSAQAQMAGVRAAQASTQQEAAQWAYQQRLHLAEADQAQNMMQWQAPGAQLDDYLRRSQGVGSMGSHTVGPPPVQPNWMQGMGSTAMGLGAMGLSGQFGGGRQGAPTGYDYSTMPNSFGG